MASVVQTDDIKSYSLMRDSPQLENATPVERMENAAPKVLQDASLMENTTQMKHLVTIRIAPRWENAAPGIAAQSMLSVSAMGPASRKENAAPGRATHKTP